MLELGKFVQDVTRWCNGIAAVKQFLISQLGCCREAKGNRFVPRDLAILAGWEFSGGNLIMDREGLRREAVVLVRL